jgi:hypothetical protein
LASYWGDLLGKNEMRAYQASHRGGCILLKKETPGRVKLIGKSVIVLKGSINVPDEN